jgi:bifunctional UDP-N-acetylglucosamine pyrophosphorylase/glucosamine-1-phosphate N-acetyltransferase
MLIAMILAAGKGTRMRSEVPKLLHPLLGEPLLEHVLGKVDLLAPERGLRAKVLVVGHGREEIRRAFDSRGITWAVQEEQQGTAHAVHCGLAALPAALADPRADVLVLNGDLPLLRRETIEGLLDRHSRERAEVTILTCEKPDPTGYGRVIRGEGGAITGIIEEKDASESDRKLREVNVGTYVFRAGTFREFYDRIDRSNAQGELYLTDVVVQAARAGRQIASHPAADDAETAQVNSRSDMARVASILRSMLIEEHMLAGVTIDDPSTTYIERGVRIGRDTRILPFTVIHRGVEIGSECEVGPFAHLREGARLADGASVGNFVEIKNTTLGRRTKVRHLSYLGDGVVGESVNIGAGTIFANYDGKVKSTTVVKDGAFVGSGTVLVAPVTVGEKAITGAGSVILKNHDVPDNEVVAGVPARPLRKKT